MHKLADRLEFLMEARGGKGGGMRRPIVRAVGEEREKVAKLLGVFGEELQLTEPLGAEEGNGRHAITTEPSSAAMEAAETTADLDEEGPSGSKGDQFW